MNLLDVYEVLFETDIVRISWLTETKDIIVMEIKGQWHWEVAITAVETINQHVLARQPDPVYTIYYYQMPKIPLFPRTVKLANLRRLIEIDPPNEQLVIFVRTDSLLQRFINILTKTYGLRHILQKYKFVPTWENAMTEIEKHRASHRASS